MNNLNEFIKRSGRILIVFLLSGNLFAQVELPAMFSDNMVLQQEFACPVWGWAKAGESITVKGSWDNNAITTLADNTGDWNLKLPTPEAGGPYFVTINDDTLHNVLIGEVWVCSGQSNMQRALSRTDSTRQEIEKANYPDIRLFYVARDNADEPKNNCYGKWEICTPESAESFSAVAYYFGKELNKELDVPIGLLHTSWGGSTAQAWINYPVLQFTPEGRYYIEKYKEKTKSSPPGILARSHQSPSGPSDQRATREPADVSTRTTRSPPCSVVVFSTPGVSTRNGVIAIHTGTLRAPATCGSE